MSIFDNTNMKKPLSDLFPDSWKNKVNSCNYLHFRNLDHFIYSVSQITQKEDNKCDMTYEEALRKLKNRESDFPVEEQLSIRNLVRKNLHKRGLITEEVYEAFRYDTGGTNLGVDVGKYAAGEPDCVLTPERRYINFFYELYVSISYPYTVSNTDVRKNIAKLLATIEELERQHIFIKIDIVFPDIGCNLGQGSKNFFSVIPLFSHKDPKSVETMSAVINDRLLRKFYFAILEDIYGSDLALGYGHPIDLDTAMNVGYEFNEIEFFETVVKSVGA